MKKIYIISISLFFCFFKVEAQLPILKRAPDFLKAESPNASSFNKFIENPIGLYTGNPDVSISIFNLKDGMINIPITLRYNTSGIKVDEEASWVGLGWNLNVGGVIVRNAIGGDDNRDDVEIYKTFINKVNANDVYKGYTPLTRDMFFSESVSPLYQWDIYLGSLNEDRKGLLSPDIFNFSYPGGSGKFIKDYRTGKIFQPARENGIRIDDNYRITTEEGIEHVYSYHSSIKDPTKASAVSSDNFVLTTSNYPNGQVVKYTYEKIPYTGFIYSMTYQSIVPLQGEANPSIFGVDNKIRSYHLKGEDFILSKIETTNYEIIFETTDRLDIKGGKALKEMRIIKKVGALNENNNIKSFYFEQGYFEGKEVGGSKKSTVLSSDLKRLKLTSLYEKSCGKIDNKYNFYYNEETLPQKTSFAEDYWGYYNGQNNQGPFPDMDYLLWVSKDDIYTKRITPSNGFYPKGVRASDEKFAKAGILVGIEYPTGGYNEFEYELNSFSGNYIPTIGEVKKYNDIKKRGTSVSYNNPSTDRTFNFTLYTPTTIDVTINISCGKDHNTWYALQKTYVAIIKPGNSSPLVKLWNFDKQCFDRYQNIVSGNVLETYSLELPAGNYTLSAKLPPSLENQYGAALNMASVTANISYDLTPRTNTGESNGAGLRIKKINKYNLIDKKELLLSTQYEYKENTGKTSGILHKKPIFHYNNSGYYCVMTQVWSWSGSSGYYIDFAPEYRFVPDQLEISNNIHSYDPYGNDPIVGYSRVVEKTLKNNTSDSSCIEFKFYNVEPKINRFNYHVSDSKNGKILERNIYSSNSALISKEKYDYETITYYNHFGVNYTDYVNSFSNIAANYYTGENGKDRFLPEDYQGGGKVIMSSKEFRFMNGNRGGLYLFELNGNDVFLKSKESTIDGIKTIEDYIYNKSTHQLKSKLTKLEEGRTIENRYYYPNDYSGIYFFMAQLNIISPIVEERIYRDGYYIGGSATYYHQNLPRTRRFAVMNSKRTDIPIHSNGPGTEPDIYPSVDVSYNNYDKYYNIVNMDYQGTTTTTYLWSYNGQYPVAEITGASYDQVKIALGKKPEDLSLTASPDMTLINGLRSKLPNAHVTTYTYKPLVGILTATDPRGITTYYEYDSFGRLQCTYIEELDSAGKLQKKVVQKFDYHYRNQ